MLLALAIAVAALVSNTATAAAPAKLKVVGAYATPIEEPWDGVIHSALKARRRRPDRLHVHRRHRLRGADGARPARDRREEQPDVIFGDAFGNEEAVRRSPPTFPTIAFVFGSGGGPAEPEPLGVRQLDPRARLPGRACWPAALTKSNIIGVVGGCPVPEVNRLVNAYIAGAQSVNPKVEVKVSFINSFRSGDRQGGGAGPDRRRRRRALRRARRRHRGRQGEGRPRHRQHERPAAEAPENVITSVVWNMQPTVDYVLNQVAAGRYTAQDLRTSR